MLYDTAKIKEHRLEPVMHYFTICYMLSLKLNRKKDFYDNKHYFV